MTSRVVLLQIPYYEMLLDAANFLSRAIGCPLVQIDPFRYIPRHRQRDIVLGAHGAAIPLSANSVIYNTEHPSTWSKAYISRLIQLPYWSYAPTFSGTYVPLGFIPELLTVPPSEKDIDVLFFGSPSPRRAKVLDRLFARGLVCYSPTAVYGAERSAIIDRAKVVLNIHYYTDPPYLESSRVIPALHRGACVLSEASIGLPVCAQVPYDRLVDEAEKICRSPALRETLVASSLRALKKPPMSETVKGLL